jgi:hypothetical protein
MKKKYKKGNPWTIKTELMTIYLDVLYRTLCTGEEGATIKNTNERITTLSTHHVQDTKCIYQTRTMKTLNQKE